MKYALVLKLAAVAVIGLATPVLAQGGGSAGAGSTTSGIASGSGTAGGSSNVTTTSSPTASTTTGASGSAGAGGALGTTRSNTGDPSVDRQDSAVDGKIKSICKGC